MDEERVVLLGTVQERQSVDNSSPYVCKAGGTPAWYSEPPSEANNLTCAKCGKGLFLVAQVYAPVETDRTLYVFGCNSVACTESPGSWRVLRDQVEPVKETPVEAEIEEVTQEVDQVKLAWGSDSDDSDWSEDEDDTKVAAPAADLVDLEALLQQRDDAMKTIANTTNLASAPKKAELAKETALTGKRNAFPALSIEVIDEPYEDYTAEHDFDHENRLLEEYMNHEEEEKSTDIGNLRSVITNSKKKGGAAQSGGAASSAGESYEKTPAQQRHLLRFQKRISRCPLQCLRYDYGGEPLWPVVIPLNLKVPPCPSCGEERSFEMQLTPTINYFLKVDEYASADAASQQKPSPTPDTAALDTPKSMAPPGGMDWLSLVVYSCSASCAQSHEEFMYVVPSPTA
ncbi:programmed cell death protein [Phytophthora pseudosyringae]|uniref:Programmed cell death protein n=1 Tax=Phytophthora pseudosyringae TaxID=221518 RepID=A0A8T1WCC4_9STRA|nr:programmed cell death protein [Phytophthora pseudosyringae]